MNKGKIIVAGIGPGSEADITPAGFGRYPKLGCHHRI